MKVKELIKILKRYKSAELLVNNQPVRFEAYENEKGNLILNLSFSTPAESLVK